METAWCCDSKSLDERLAQVATKLFSSEVEEVELWSVPRDTDGEFGSPVRHHEAERERSPNFR